MKIEKKKKRVVRKEIKKKTARISHGGDEERFDNFVL